MYDKDLIAFDNQSRGKDSRFGTELITYYGFKSGKINFKILN